METIFHDERAPFGESFVSKTLGTFVPIWEDIENDLEPDLRGLLEWKRKRKEAPTVESDNLLCYVRIKTPNGRMVYKL